jgi:predicted transcriptional regulator
MDSKKQLCKIKILNTILKNEDKDINMFEIMNVCGFDYSDVTEAMEELKKEGLIVNNNK